MPLACWRLPQHTILVVLVAGLFDYFFTVYERNCMKLSYWVRRTSWYVLIMVLFSLLPHTVAAQKLAPEIASTTADLPQVATVTVPPLTNPRTPSLFLDLQVAPDSLAV